MVVFGIGFALSLLVREVTWTERVIMAVFPASMVFVAFLVLSIRDHVEHSVVMQSVRDKLLISRDTSNDDFLSLKPFDEATILLDVRQAISDFFDVPAKKVNRDVRLFQDLHADKLEPSFQFSVVHTVIASRMQEPKPFLFSLAGLETLDDLAVAIRDILDGDERTREEMAK